MFDGGTILEALAGAPGAELAGAVSALDVSALDDVTALALAGACERLASWAVARQAEAVARFARVRPSADGSWIDEFAVGELSTELCLSSVAAQNLVGFSHALQGLPATAAALRAGRIDARRARAIVDGVSHVDAGTAAAVEARVLPGAVEQSPGQVRAAVARAVIAADPAGAGVRHERARSERRVEIRPQPEGMASLWALLPAESAVAVREALNRAARAGSHAGDDRSMDNRRADALVALCTGAVSPPATEVRVVVDAATLARLQDDPAHLVGYGPVPPALARALAGDARWRRMVVAPQTGELLDVGRRTYRPSDALAAFVQARDVCCRFPGCRRTACDDDLDHVVPFPVGQTVRSNLAPLCRRHHRLKTHAPGWSVRREADGSLWWTTPTGKTFISRPDPDAPGAHIRNASAADGGMDGGGMDGGGMDDFGAGLDAAIDAAAQERARAADEASRPPEPQPPPEPPPF